MWRSIVIWSATALGAATVACGGSTQQEVLSPPTAIRCPIGFVTPQFPAAGAQVSVQLTATRDCAWAVQGVPDWLRIEPTAGQGNGTLTIVATPNPLGRNRTTTLDISGQSFTVVQEGVPCRFEARPSTIEVGHQGGRVSLQLTTLEGCTWTTQSSQPWLRVIRPSGGDTSSTIELAIDSNQAAERSAVLTIATLVVAVNQDAGPGDNSACRFSIGPGSHLIPAAGGTNSFVVATRPGCAWTVSSNRPWIRILTTFNPIGPDTVRYEVDPNPSTASRSGIISAGTRRHVVTQEGIARP
jgi:hypothetical protein